MKTLITIIFLSFPLLGFTQNVTNDFYTLESVEESGNVVMYRTTDVHVVQKGLDWDNDGKYMLSTQEVTHVRIVIDGWYEVNFKVRKVFHDHGDMSTTDIFRHTTTKYFKNPLDNSSVSTTWHYDYKYVGGKFVPINNFSTGPELYRE